MTPTFVTESAPCQSWQCGELARWNRWSGFYCYTHAILCGWLPGPVQRRWDQMGLAV